MRRMTPVCSIGAAINFANNFSTAMMVASAMFSKTGRVVRPRGVEMPSLNAAHGKNGSKRNSRENG